MSSRSRRLALAVAVVAVTPFLAGTDRAAAQAPATEVTVVPSTGLADGQEVQVTIAGFLPSTMFGSAICDGTEPLTLDHCDFVATTPSPSDPSGAATFARTVSRYIVTASGIHDCAVDACRLAVASFNLTGLGTAPISFAPGPPPAAGLGLALGEPTVLAQDPTGPATVPVTLTCDAPATVTLTFTMAQVPATGGTAGRTVSLIQVPCQPGSPMAVTSDLMGIFDPGPAEVLVRATAGEAHATAMGDVEVQSAAAAHAALAARLADPTDTTVLADFWAALTFRLAYNPEFARTFWRAVLAATSG